MMITVQFLRRMLLMQLLGVLEIMPLTRSANQCHHHHKQRKQFHRRATYPHLPKNAIPNPTPLANC